MSRNPVVVAPDEIRPTDGWMSGDSFFFSVDDKILVFTVMGFDTNLGIRTSYTQRISSPNRITGISPEPNVTAYLERLKSNAKAQTKADLIWDAVMEFGKP